jgi:hypothetical protein
MYGLLTVVDPCAHSAAWFDARFAPVHQRQRPSTIITLLNRFGPFLIWEYRKIFANCLLKAVTESGPQAAEHSR